jgi:omega-6 fatty acid desaturase (delta-12 desaturase)
MQRIRLAPSSAVCAKLRSSNGIGFLYTGGIASITAAGLALSRFTGAVWLTGEILLAIALVQWFILLHECGHETLFRSSWLNVIVGHVASYFSIIPFQNWRRVHTSHHQWTGWQDLDPTTASLVPRPLSRPERWLINTSWRYWIPTFSAIYRINNYWNLSRLRALYGAGRTSRKMWVNAVLLLAAYIVTVRLVGFESLVKIAGLGLLLAMVFEDPLILSQHTHIPQQASGGKKVRPFSAFDQEAFTRSLRFPAWISKFLLLNFDAHELHHMYPFVPGYHLRRIAYVGANEVHWWTWLRAVKQIPGDQFLFRNRNNSGAMV